MNELFDNEDIEKSIEVEAVPVVEEQKANLPVSVDAYQLIQKGMETNTLNAGDIERLVELANRERERQAKRDFDFHFSEMQKEFTPMERTKKGDKGLYAPLDAMQKKYNHIITRHGFSYSWTEKPLADGAVDIILTISGYGHSKETHKVLPLYVPDKGSTSGKAIMTNLQAEGTRDTYGHRYTFKAGFGITETDEDTDGAFNYEDGIYLSEPIQLIRSCGTMEELKETWKDVYSSYAGDQLNMKILNAEKDKQKKIIQGGKNVQG